MSAHVTLARNHGAPQAMPQPAASAPDYSGVKYGPMLKLRCPDGEYRGREPGKKVWTEDTYTWAVSRDFARRFCMPESMIDEGLKGAEAVAVRVKPSDEATCRMEEGQEVCRRKAELQLELYLRSDLGLPKSHPEVRFYHSRRVETSSGLLILTNQALKDDSRRAAGVWVPPSGKIAPYHSLDESRRVKFMYLNFGEGGLARPGSDLVEKLYLRDWIDGLDLIRLDGTSIGLGYIADPRTTLLSRSFGIGVINETDLPGNREGLRQMTRDRYVHVVELPRQISELIYTYDKQQGDLFMNAVKRALSAPGVPPAPR